MGVLVNFVFCFVLSTRHKLESFGKKNISWENSSIRLSCGVFSWLMTADVGEPSTLQGYHHWDGGPGFFERAGWATHGEQASKQHSLMASTSVPALSSCPGFPQWWTVSCNSHQPTVKVAFDPGGYHSNRNIIRTAFGRSSLNRLWQQVPSAVLTKISYRRGIKRPSEPGDRCRSVRNDRHITSLCKDTHIYFTKKKKSLNSQSSAKSFQCQLIKKNWRLSSLN